MEVDEMMDLLERKSAKEEWKFPKNIRQIGEPGQEGFKVFIEDYAYTYLHQLAKANLTCIKTAVLVGNIEQDTVIYIQGVIEIEMGQEIRKWFSNENWRDIFQYLQKWFEGQEIVGWFMSNPGFPPVLNDELVNLHMRHFSGSKYVFMQMDILENEEVFYACGEKGLAPLGGYYIFYKKNEQMLTYMSQKRGGVSIEPEGIMKDRATARFRNMMQEKKEHNSQRKSLFLLYTACTFLVMVILVIGITIVNNDDRMEHMESALHQISQTLVESDMPETQTENKEDMLTDKEAEEAAVQLENQHFLDEQQEKENPVEEKNEENEETAQNEQQVEEPKEEIKEEVPEEEVPEKETAQEPIEEPVEEETKEVISQSVKEPEKYYVQKGDTLLDICRARYGNDEMMAKICEINGLDDSDKIYAGEVIFLP